MLDITKILNENVLILPSGVVTICEGIEINHKKVYKHFFFFFCTSCSNCQLHKETSDAFRMRPQSDLY